MIRSVFGRRDRGLEQATDGAVGGHVYWLVNRYGRQGDPQEKRLHRTAAVTTRQRWNRKNKDFDSPNNKAEEISLVKISDCILKNKKFSNKKFYRSSHNFCRESVIFCAVIYKSLSIFMLNVYREYLYNMKRLYDTRSVFKTFGPCVHYIQRPPASSTTTSLHISLGSIEHQSTSTVPSSGNIVPEVGLLFRHTTRADERRQHGNRGESDSIRLSHGEVFCRKRQVEPRRV